MAGNATYLDLPQFIFFKYLKKGIIVRYCLISESGAFVNGVAKEMLRAESTFEGR